MEYGIGAMSLSGTTTVRPKQTLAGMANELNDVLEVAGDRLLGIVARVAGLPYHPKASGDKAPGPVPFHRDMVEGALERARRLAKMVEQLEETLS